MSIPFTHDDLGEDDYREHPAPTPDRHINFDQVHDPFYSQTDSPAPYPE
jgi:hypothetical protein